MTIWIKNTYTKWFFPFLSTQRSQVFGALVNEKTATQRRRYDGSFRDDGLPTKLLN